MHYKKITKMAMSLLLTVGVSSSLMADSFSDKQQKDLQSARATWTEKNIPSGMQSGEVRASTERDSGADNVSMYLHNVNFDVVDNIGFYIEKLKVTLEPKVAGNPVVFDDVESFTINVHSGTVVLSPQVIADLFNDHILDYWPRPLDDLTITTSENYLEVEGGLKLWSWFPGIYLPADLGGNIVLSEDNKLVYEIDDVRVLGIPLYGLLSAIFIDLDLLLSIDRAGAELVDSVLVLDHTTVFPPPALSGRLASASLDSDGLRLVFADNNAAEFTAPSVESGSYIWAQSGDARLFDIVVTNGGVQVIAEDTSKPLRFNLYDYRKQVAAGTLTMAKNGDIVATIPSSEGPDYKAAAMQGGMPTGSPSSSSASNEPAPGCINRAGFNTCEEKKVERKTMARSAKSTSSVSKSTAEKSEGFLSTEGKMKLKDMKAGTCFNRAGFVIACQ
ncbi:MAG TPA: hypothetical protein EYG50_03235 [Cycloclasticus sp.]|nr:hypothetical protein [Cycloclasticus sp.]HIL91753.1 hypothetical protein [Cycloclasticus sp.]